MNAQDFRNQNLLNYADYQRICQKYSQVASFAYWVDNFVATKYAAPDLLVNNETEFDERLKGNLQKGVAMIGLNFGARKKDKLYTEVMHSAQLPVAQRLALRREINNLSNQYAKKGAYRSMYPALDTYQAAPSVFKGAYMTDLFKFALDEKQAWIGAGIATPEGRDLQQVLDGQPELIAENIQGLKYELQTVVGMPERCILVLMGGQVQGYAAQIKQAFPQALVLNFGHYSAYQFSHEQWLAKGEKLNATALAGIANW
ncbi:hypothetical protein [Loigolactobacillus binensis]|uniref:Uracil-DNA glycosylase-like domain-containing protein n=1 Tax=Loigolactobacillus binensis TaxID=2559922 RepID=A0ABW3E943_9LACO|nr:hypothetical protein [Loigolactobacillus binensis]